jgi:error-prone DNA polymerase
MAYAELRCKTNFSFLQGASHPDELATRAAELGYSALAITDLNSLAGVVRVHVAAKPLGLKLLIGAEITPEDAPAVLLYAPDLKAYGRLSRLITRGRRAAEKGKCRLSLDDVAEHAEGLLAAVVLPSGVRRICNPSGEPQTDWKSVLRNLAQYREIFPGRCYLTASLHRGPDDDAELDRLIWLSRQASTPLIATNDVYYHVAERRLLHDVLTAVRHGLTVAELGALRFSNGERHLKPPAEMCELFHRYPRAITYGLELADRCHFSLEELRYEYPEEVCPPGLTPTEHLSRLTWAGARERYPKGVPEKVAALLQRELGLIGELRYEAYFLTVWDLVTFARSKNILCQGRGSAANSAVCYCLGVTSVDPDRSDVLFERFVSRERDEPPDIDVDFEHERREEVLQYVYEKYGRDRAGITAEVITYRPRSAVRDVGKALGLSLDCVDRLAKTLDHYGRDFNLTEHAKDAGLDPNSPGATHLIQLVTEVLSFPRHLSQHVGGFVITRGLLSELVPIENAAMPDRTVIQWDKDDLDALGILKVDCLALGMLTAIHKSFDLISKHHTPSPLPLSPSEGERGTRESLLPSGERGRGEGVVEWALATVPAEDPATYDMIGRADTVGVFQIESRAQMSMLPRLLPRCFYDLVIEVAIVRPGPIQGGMVHPYLRRRNGLEPVTYHDATIERVLGKTLGIPIFQEQVLRLAMTAAGFSAGEADQLRRAIGAWRRPALLDSFRAKFRDGILAHGLPAPFADQLYEQIKGFGEYGFPEAHAASFALLAYVSAWLKCHYPAAFAAALLNSQPMGFYEPAQIVRDLREHDVAVRPVDVNHSEWDCTLELEKGVGSLFELHSSSEAEESKRLPTPFSSGPALRLGYRLVRGFPQAMARKIADAWADGPFRSLPDFARRTRLSRPMLARLAAADVFGSLGLNRRMALWHVLAVEDDLPLFPEIEPADDPPPLLPEMSLEGHVLADYDSTGLSLKAHPVSFIRSELTKLRALTAAELAETRDKAAVRVAGLVLVRQRPATAKGTVFITLEDETGIVNLIVWPRVWQRYRKLVPQAVALLVEGRVERAGQVIHVVADKLEDLTDSLRRVAIRSRDFR